MDDYQKYIHQSRYARYLDSEGRRETWEETVDRYITYFDSKLSYRYSMDDHGLIYSEVRQAILDMEVMPSMRCMMTAGEALDRDNVAGYNCAYLAVDSPRAFDEAMYVLLCGTGVGFSVERQYVQKLPEVSEEFHETDTTIIVADSKIGWAKSYRELISMLYAGQIPKWDVSKVRPSGSRLKTFGGRASGPEPLIDLFQFTVEIFKEASGRKLTSLECHDIMCKVADIVVVGGVRRSALISLSNLTDERMRKAKSGQWWEANPQRALSNNSVAYTEKPDVGIFLREMESLYESKSGERGIFNREAARKAAARSGRRETDSIEFGCNPCSEIILRPKQFCNLTEVVVRPSDTFDDLRRKVEIATILGTMQSTLTDFRYLSSAWKRNTEEERLLGVSLTGIMDHPVLSGSGDMPNQLAESMGVDSRIKTKDLLPALLYKLKEVAIETNKKWANKLGINPSVAITCVKPSGTVSQLVDSSSGIHPRFSPYYIRTVRSDNKDPLTQFLIAQGVPHEPAIGKESTTTVFSFPKKAPDTSVVENDVSALEQLELWKIYQEHWCEHKPSVTIYYSDDEYPKVMAWLWDHFDEISGISLLPKSDHSYKQAPYQEITEEKYNELIKGMPEIKWEDFTEESDNTTGSQEMACTGNSCEVV